MINTFKVGQVKKTLSGRIRLC